MWWKNEADGGNGGRGYGSRRIRSISYGYIAMVCTVQGEPGAVERKASGLKGRKFAGGAGDWVKRVI